MDGPLDTAALLHSMLEALDADDPDTAQALLQRHDQQVRELARALGESPGGRQQLLDLQRLQVALIELLRGRRDAISDELQALGRAGKARRAYREQEAP